jgi:hypothetical protein
MYREDGECERESGEKMVDAVPVTWPGLCEQY